MREFYCNSMLDDDILFYLPIKLSNTLLYYEVIGPPINLMANIICITLWRLYIIIKILEKTRREQHNTEFC